MAESKSINTRIVLRNDTLENWVASEKTLLKGEAALANLGNETFEIRIGTGDKTWNQLSAVPGYSNLIFKSSNITDLLDTISANETNTSYQIKSVSLSSGETGTSFQLQSKGKFDESWTDVEGSRFNVPAFNPKYLEDQILEISGQVSSFSNDWKSGVDTALTETLPQAIANAQSAAELSAQAVRNDLTGYVQYTDVQGGSAALTGNNKIATMADIVGLSGSVHILGTIENDESTSGKSDQTIIVETYPAAKRGAIVINTANSKEYVCMAEIGATAIASDWIELGDEGLYAKKSDLQLSVTNLLTGISNEKTRAEGIEEGLRTDLNALSGKYDTFVGTTYVNDYQTLSNALTSEADRAKGIEGGLRSDINTVSGDLDTLESIAVLSVKLNDQYFTVSDNVASLDISYINCGNAS